MKSITKVITLLVLSASCLPLCGCASGFTFDGVHYIGRDKDFFYPEETDTGFIAISFSKENNCSER